MTFDGLHSGTIANWVAHIYFQTDLVKAAGMNTAYAHLFFLSTVLQGPSRWSVSGRLEGPFWIVSLTGGVYRRPWEWSQPLIEWWLTLYVCPTFQEKYNYWGDCPFICPFSGSLNEKTTCECVNEIKIERRGERPHDDAITVIHELTTALLLSLHSGNCTDGRPTTPRRHQPGSRYQFMYLHCFFYKIFIVYLNCSHNSYFQSKGYMCVVG